MNFRNIIWTAAFALILACPCLCGQTDKGVSGQPRPRLANGTVISGELIARAPGGLVFRQAQGEITIPWKYLSAGTRYRYERADSEQAVIPPPPDE